MFLIVIKEIITKLFFKFFSAFLKEAESFPIDEEQSFYEFLEDFYKNNGGEWDEVNIFGIRDEKNMREDVFNDIIGVATKGDVHLFSATCDPGVYYTKNGGVNGDGKGVAHLCLGFHKNAYMVGIHRGYEALVQRGAPVKIWRDKNKNFEKDSQENLERGFFGINIHRASAIDKVTSIGKYSAGCQVVRSHEDFKKLLKIVRSSKTFKSRGTSATFSYFLIPIEKIPSNYLSDCY